jgi:precorrin-6B methylase 2
LYFLTLHRDAGVILSALLEELSQPSNAPPAGLRLLGNLIKDVPSPSVLELGTGCGIVAITFALSVPSSRVIATDLEDAAEVASDNLEQADNASYLNLDWSEPLPPRVASKNFDLVLVADCTYNPDVVPYLVSTLAKLIEKSPSVLICLAMKVRHASEAVFFDLMKDHGIVQVGKHSERVGNLGDEDESVDIYLFKGAEAAKVSEQRV